MAGARDRTVEQGDGIAARVVALVRELAIELRPGAAASLRVEPDSRLDSDLGIDSLGRAELALRLETQLGVGISGERLAEIVTVGDLVRAVLAAGGAPATAFTLETQQTLGAEEVPTRARTLTEVLDWHAQRHGERTHVHLLRENAAAEPLSYRELAERAERIGAGLVQAGVQPGDRVVLMMPTCSAFLAGFMGVLRAGGVAVPIYPPFRLDQLADHLLRQKRIIANAAPALLLVTPELSRAGALLRGIVPGLRTATLDDGFGTRAAPVTVTRGADDLAMLQYTSGSTGDPKGVMLTHANLLANIRAMGAALRASPADVCVSWLPLYHDMGLIGAWLGSLYHAATLVLMAPQHFLARPADWLRAIHAARGTVTAAPNFAYELCLRRVPDALIDELDLSCVRVFANGAEPVRASTLRRFAARFARCGLRAEALKPVYGLAENAVGLAFPALDQPPRIEAVARAPLQEAGIVRPPVAAEEAIECVACGRPLPGHEIRIVDAAGRELPERREGRIQFRGPSSTPGYFRSEQATRGLFADGWLETGDLGWFAEGDLFIGGRVKDVIIRAGRNLHPQDIEAAVEEVEGVRRGCVAAVGLPDGGEGGERLVLLVETRLVDPPARERLRAAIAERVVAALGEPADEIVLLPPHSLPKTSSGKLRRSLARELYLAGSLGTTMGGRAGQLLILARLAAAERLRGLWQRGRTLLFGLRFWAAIALLAPVAWLLVMLLPDAGSVRRLLRQLARAGFAIAGIPLRVAGLDNLPAGPCLLVANHASYLDGPVLVAALPCAPAFVAKRELADNPLAGPFLRRLGSIFVGRWSRGEGTIDVERVRDLLTHGRVPVVFPEGTFTRAPGLLPFHLGAFQLAAGLRLPVVPVVIRGTRSVLRADQWIPFRAAIEVEVLPPLAPEGAGFEAARALRDRVRAAMLAAVREPDLESEVVIPE